jgi:hypothetical protein
MWPESIADRGAIADSAALRFEIVEAGKWRDDHGASLGTGPFKMRGAGGIRAMVHGGKDYLPER